MKLLVDLGNSCLKWATLMQDELSQQQRVFYQKDNIQQCFSQHWTNLPCPDEGIWVSNVAGPQPAEAMRSWVETQWGVSLTCVETSEAAAGVTNGYHIPKQLGVDRWMAIIGAHHLMTGMKCVVDCGTAITLDVVTESGLHLGGLIMPGITTMRKVLLKDTYALATLINPQQSIEWQNQQIESPTPTTDDSLSTIHHPLSTNTTIHHPLSTIHYPLTALSTTSGIVLGTLYAVVGWVEYTINHLKNSGSTVTLVITGGNAPELLPYLSTPGCHIPDLVLQGMYRIVKKAL